MLLVALLSLLASPLIEAAFPSSAEVHRRAYSMGTRLDVWVTARSRSDALADSELALRAVEESDALLSTWQPDSPLQGISRLTDGSLVDPSEELSAALDAVLHCESVTRGAFRLSPSSSRPALVEVGKGYRRQGDTPLDSGGFGKGHALDRAIDAALAAGAQRIELDFGGQRALGSTDEQPRPLVVDLAHPQNRRTAVLRLTLPGNRRSLATSGTSERGAHLLDPSSGRPVVHRGTFSVVAANGLLADCLSTGFYVLGREAALDVAARLPGIELLVLDLFEGRLRASSTRGLEPHLQPLAALDLWVDGVTRMSDGGPHGPTRKPAAARDRRREPPATGE